MKCKVLVYDSKRKIEEWINGEVVGYRVGDSSEDFNRIDVKVEYGIYEGCHPECVNII